MSYASLFLLDFFPNGKCNFLRRFLNSSSRLDESVELVSSTWVSPCVDGVIVAIPDGAVVIGNAVIVDVFDIVDDPPPMMLLTDNVDDGKDIPIVAGDICAPGVPVPIAVVDGKCVEIG